MAGIRGCDFTDRLYFCTAIQNVSVISNIRVVHLSQNVLHCQCNDKV